MTRSTLPLHILSHAYTLEDILTFGTLTSVVKLLLLGCDGSLLSCARMLSGLREVFLRGVGKLTRCTSQREGISSNRSGAHSRTNKCSMPHERGHTRGNCALPARGHCTSWITAASFTLPEIHRKCKIRSYAARNWDEHCCCFRKEKKLKWFLGFVIHVV